MVLVRFLFMTGQQSVGFLGNNRHHDFSNKNIYINCYKSNTILLPNNQNNNKNLQLVTKTKSPTQLHQRPPNIQQSSTEIKTNPFKLVHMNLKQLKHSNQFMTLTQNNLNIQNSHTNSKLLKQVLITYQKSQYSSRKCQQITNIIQGIFSITSPLSLEEPSSSAQAK